MSDDDRRAAAAITRLLQRWLVDLTDPASDASIPATEILTVLRGHGWRPTPARRPEPWQPQPGQTYACEPTPEWHAAAAAIRHHPPMNAPATGDDQ